MKWRPIMFWHPLIPRVMDGTKTQTRRLVNMESLRVDLRREVHSDLADLFPSSLITVKPGRHRARLNPQGAVFLQDPKMGLKPGEFHFVCPLADGETVYGTRDGGSKGWMILAEPDQRLWVRETWQAWRQTSVEYDEWEVETDAEGMQSATIEYRATSKSTGPWRPSIFMPRWASRASLGVALVRLERLQDITELDILAEGVTVDAVAKWTNTRWSDMPTLHHAWEVLWNHLNHKRAPYDSNPWVWACTFKKIEVT